MTDYPIRLYEVSRSDTMVNYENFTYKGLENVYVYDDDEFNGYVKTINELIQSNFDAFIRAPYESRALFLLRCLCNSDTCKAKPRP